MDILSGIGAIMIVLLGLMTFYNMLSKLLRNKTENKLELIFYLVIVGGLSIFILSIVVNMISQERRAVAYQKKIANKSKVLTEKIEFLGQEIPVGSKVDYASHELKYIRKITASKKFMFKLMWINGLSVGKYEPMINDTIRYNDLLRIGGNKVDKTTLLLDINLSEDANISNWSCSKNANVKIFESKLLYSCKINKATNIHGAMVGELSDVVLYNKYYRDPSKIDPIWKITSREHKQSLILSGFECAVGAEATLLDNGTLLSCEIKNKFHTDVIDIPAHSNVSLSNADEIFHKNFEPIWGFSLSNITIKGYFFDSLYVLYKQGKVIEVKGWKKYKKDYTLKELKEGSDD